MATVAELPSRRDASIWLNDGVRVELVADPRGLTADRALEITEGMIDVTWRACRGDAQELWPAIRDGWDQYYQDGGSRAEHYDRLALIYSEQRLVQFSGMMVKRLAPDTTLLWFHIACTDPEFQGAGAFAKALFMLVDPEWCGSFGDPTYVVFRTPNPLVYVAARTFAENVVPTWDFQPRIAPGATLEPLPDGGRELAQQMSTAIAPGSEYDPEALVVRDFLGEYGAIYRTPAPPSDDPVVNAYFDAHLRRQPQDALFGFVRVQ